MPVQLTKAEAPTEVISFKLHTPSVSLLKVLRLLQLLKQLSGMVVILSVGHFTAVMPVPEKALFPTEVIPVKLHTLSLSLLKVVRFVQPLKQLSGMVVILSVGHVTLVMPVSQKA